MIYLNENGRRHVTSSIPACLQKINDAWDQFARDHGDEGSCVIGAGFNFRFQGLRWRMTPSGPWQGSISWETSVPKIRAMLHEAGADDIGYDWGDLD